MSYSIPKPSHTLYLHLIPKALTLLETLPSSVKEIKQRLPHVELKELQHCFLYLVCTQTLTQSQGDQLSPLFKIIGSDEIEEHLLKAFKQTECIPLKEQLLAMIFHSEVGLELFEDLNDEERVELCGPWMRPMMLLAKNQPFPRYALCALYTSTPQTQQPYLLEKMESYRSANRLNPAHTYEVLIKQGLSPLHSELFLTQINRNGDLEYLEPLLDEAPKEIRYFYKHLMNYSPSSSQVS